MGNVSNIYILRSFTSLSRSSFFSSFLLTFVKRILRFPEAIKKGSEQEISLDSVTVKADSLDIEEARKALKKNQKVIGLSDEELGGLDSVMTSESEISDLSFGFKRKLLDSLIAIGAPLKQKLEAMGMKEDTNAFGRRFYEQMLKFYEKQGGGILQVLYDTIPIAMFLLLPLFAVFLKVFYWKPATFAHHLVFSFYFFTFIFTSFCVMLLVDKVWEIPTSIKTLICFSFVLYLMLALRNFYKSSWLGAFLKASTISLLYMLIIVPVAAVGIIMVTFMLY